MNIQQNYERRPREYTLLGITGVFEKFFKPEFIELYGGTFSDIISVIENGIYYHYESADDKYRVNISFLKKINDGEIDLDKMYREFDLAVDQYEKLLQQKESDYSLQTILDFYNLYQEIIPVAYASMDSLDFLDVLDESKREFFTQWALKVRKRAEMVYKKGEAEFIPAFCEWLAKNHFKEYTAKQLSYVLPHEKRDYIIFGKAIPTPEVLNQRIEFCYVRQYPMGQIEIYTGDEAKQKMQEKGLLTNLQIGEPVSEVSGQVAFAGKVTGTARIIITRQDMQKFCDGDIIISSMTDPSFLPIMKRASAFVTDEGGVLCHAAIVAREMKKPCVIGTKIATKVFKDGDMVEVDAENGIVKRI